MKTFCHFFLILLSLSILIPDITAQVGINTDGSSPDPSAMLDVKSTDKGLLMPRSDTTMVNANGTPATGLILYQSSDNRFYYFNGTNWIGLNTGSGAFEKFGNLVRQVSGTDTDNLIFGRETLPVSGEMIYDTLLFFNQQKGAFRGGMVTNDDVWGEEYLGLGSFAYGQAVNSMGKNAVAMGNSCYASGDYSVAMGRGIYSPSGYEFGFGKHNTIYTPVSTSGWHDTDRLFSIGNGTVLSPSNALTMLKNGHIGLGTENPLSHFSIRGDGSNDWTIASYTDAFNGRAVYGSATSGEYGTFNYGGYFETAGDNGAGVFGLASKTGYAFASGGQFESYGDYGHGVIGASNGIGGSGVYGTSYYFGEGMTNGGFFYAQSSEGRGVFGSCSGESGIGIKGMASSTGDGINYGGHFTASSSEGIGVYGYANTLSPNQNIGGKFTALGTTGIGVLATAPGFTGTAVKGIANSSINTMNYGGYFEAAGGQGIGVFGIATNESWAVNYGGKFISHGPSGRGVYGEAIEDNGIGVYGIASKTGSSSNFGGKFIALGSMGTGVYSEASGTTGYGLYSIFTGLDGMGVFAEASGDQSKGLLARATSTTGVNYGVYGISESPEGYGGFFVGKGHFSGNVGIGPGAINPDAKLEIDGQIKITGGTPGEGKILTSDEAGLASWQPNQNRSALGTTMATVYMDMNDLFKPHVNNCNGATERFIELFMGAGVGFCIEIDKRPAEYWNVAQEICLQNGKRLPEPWEWQTACDRNNLLSLGLNDMDNGWEWSSNFPIIQDNDGSSDYRSISVPVFGDGGCGTCQWLHIATSNSLRIENNFRCVR